MASVGLPATSGFVEFLVLLELFITILGWRFATTGVVLGAAYMLYVYRRIIFGKLEKENLMSINVILPGNHHFCSISFTGFLDGGLSHHS